MPPSKRPPSSSSSNEKSQKNLRLSPECQRLLALLSGSYGIGESAVVEILVRKEARTAGFLTDPQFGGETLAGTRGRK